MSDQPQAEFELGDEVRLHSGGPTMTVERVNRAQSAEQYVAMVESIAEAHRRPINENEPEDDEDRPWPEGEILVSYTCVWMDANEEFHHETFPPELLELVQKRGS
jgi:uncharacterized protein YodC (DUF2158 family)